MKICINCKIEKADDCFYAKINQCKECKKEYRKKYYLNNKEKKKQYSQANKEKIAERMKKYAQDNKEKISEKNRKYAQANKEEIARYQKQYRKQYEKDNKKLLAEKKRKRQIYKRNTNPAFKFKQNVKSLISGCFRQCNHKKTSKTVDILGCSVEEFKTYIERQFTKGMTLENYGDWHLDHIIPISTAKNEEDVIRLNHYTNFQPLLAKDNRLKSNKIIEKQLILI